MPQSIYLPRGKTIKDLNELAMANNKPAFHSVLDTTLPHWPTSRLSATQHEAMDLYRAYQEAGLLYQGLYETDALRQALKDWVNHGGLAAPEAQLFIEFSYAGGYSVEKINRAAQELRLRRGFLGPAMINLGQEETSRWGPLVLCEGDRVSYREKKLAGRAVEVSDFELGTITEIDEGPRIVTVAIDGGTKTKVFVDFSQPARDRQLNLGYAVANRPQRIRAENIFVMLEHHPDDRQLDIVNWQMPQAAELQRTRHAGLLRFFVDHRLDWFVNLRNHVLAAHEHQADLKVTKAEGHKQLPPGPNQDSKQRGREMTTALHSALLEDVWPSPATCCDFGIRTSDHFGALQHAVKCDGVTFEQLQAALGSGPALQELISRNNPYRHVTFRTAWDDMQPESRAELSKTDRNWQDDSEAQREQERTKKVRRDFGFEV